LASQIKRLQEVKKEIRETDPQSQVRGTGQALKTNPKVKAEYGNLSPVVDGIVDNKERPSDKVYRGRQVGGDALAKIAQRGLVGVRRLRDSPELVVYDSKPLPEGEYAIIPLSLLKNLDGMGALLTADLSSEVLFQADMTVHNASTEVLITPKLNKYNPGRYMHIQNLGIQVIYVCYDGEYDPDKDTTSLNTTPAAGIGQLLPGSGTCWAEHMMKANPRLISPSGDQTVNVMVWR
jgi:hypothetical protein